MRIPWTAPIAAVLAGLSVATLLGSGDIWLGFDLLVAAIATLILPALSPPPADDASTVATPPPPATDPVPFTGVIEATPVAARERHR